MVAADAPAAPAIHPAPRASTPEEIVAIDEQLRHWGRGNAHVRVRTYFGFDGNAALIGWGVEFERAPDADGRPYWVEMIYMVRNANHDATIVDRARKWERRERNAREAGVHIPTGRRPGDEWD